LQERGAGREMNARDRLLNGKDPAVTGDVPVNLVESVEMADLARGAIGDGILMRARSKQHVPASDIKADAIAIPLRMIGLRTPGARNALDVKRDAIAMPRRVSVVGREIAIDAAADLSPLARHRNLFADPAASVSLNPDVACEASDYLGGTENRGQKRLERERAEQDCGKAADASHALGHFPTSPISQRRHSPAGARHPPRHRQAQKTPPS